VGCWLFNEGTGDKVFDLSGNESHGTLDGPLWVPGRVGHALEFDGDDDFVEVAAMKDLYHMTFATWVYPRTDVDYRPIATKVDDTSNQSFLFSLDDDQWIWEFTVGGSLKEFSPDTTFSPNTWYFYVATYDGAYMRIYVDANELTPPFAMTGVPDPTSSLMQIGEAELWSENANALISDLWVYDRALSASEIAWLYREPYAMF
jgi:hypothetical protein